MISYRAMIPSRLAAMRFPSQTSPNAWNNVNAAKSLLFSRHIITRATSEDNVHTFHVDHDDLVQEPKIRLDTFLATKLPQTSRARLKASIKEGLVEVNHKTQSKASYIIKIGDGIQCSILPPPPLEASPENLPLNIVYEDDDILVINKEADMVMHPSPGHYTGTMVNALLQHCGLPAISLVPAGDDQSTNTTATSTSMMNSNNKGLFVDASIEEEDIDDGDGDLDFEHGNTLVLDSSSNSTTTGANSTANGILSSSTTTTVRPGIVHRLDKGTTGLVVIAKTDAAHTSLCRQFKDRQVERMYYSITLGAPRPPKARITTNIGRDFRDRKKMAAFEYDSNCGRTSASNYETLQVFADGRAALVAWKLETGRTHQIRVHAKHIGHSLMGDEVYGGTTGTAMNILVHINNKNAVNNGGKSVHTSVLSAKVMTMLKTLGRPALHAKTLGFLHPRTQERMRFDSELPNDFMMALDVLKNLYPSSD